MKRAGADLCTQKQTNASSQVLPVLRPIPRNSPGLHAQTENRTLGRLRPHLKADSRARTYGDGRGGYGLTLLVQPNGVKHWYQRLRIKGRPTNIGLGGYPLVTLAEARTVAIENARMPAPTRIPVRRVNATCPRSRMSWRPYSKGTVPPGEPDALALWDDNGSGNGRITCPEARAHGIAPVPRGHPAYRFMRDGDGDGVVCE